VLTQLAWFDLRRRDGVAVVSVSGEIDLSNCEELGDVLGRAAAGASQVVIDLSAVDYLDSTGISTLVNAARHSGAVGGRMRLVVPGSSFVRRTLLIADVPHLMPVNETLQDALEAMGSSAMS
jgi:anti-sigma B factor antagonist